MADGDKDVIDAEFVEVVDESGATKRVPVAQHLRDMGFFRGLAEDVEDFEKRANAFLALAQEARAQAPRIVESAKRLMDKVGGIKINDRKPMKR
jgi:hypothetical protein